MSKVIVLGSKGFIASNIIKKLKEKRYKFSSYSKKSINLENLSNAKKLAKIILKDDEIIFTSAVAPAKNIHDFKKNINMVINFSKVLNNLEFKKLIYISSDAIYSDSKKPLKEASKKCPDNWHGLMHLMRENILKRSFNKKKLVIVRPTLVYGKGDTHSGYGPNLFIKRAKKNKNIVLFGNGEELRDHIWINNLSEIIVMLLKKQISGEFNICTSKLISFRNIANIVAKKFKNKIENKKRIGKMPHNGYRPISNQKLLKIFPKYKFADIRNVINNNY
mgnify:CR=1 FL=1